MTNNQQPIDILVEKIHQQFKNSPDLERDIKFELDKLNRKIFSTSITQHQGWCITYKIPQIEVTNLALKLNLDLDNIKKSFVTQWKIPNVSSSPLFMYGNTYYHILLLFITYGLNYNNELLSKAALTLFCCKIWNGRRQKYIPYCNPDIMRYVVMNAGGKKYARIYDTPLHMIITKTVPNLLEKYGPEIKKDSTKTINILNQSHSRIRQLFVSDMSPNIRTGRSEANSGLAPEYFEASKKGLKLSNIKIVSSEDDDTQSINQYSTHSHEEMITDITNYISMNIDPKYDSNIIQFINKMTTTRPGHIKLILLSIHSIKYEDFIHDLIGLLFKQLQVNNKKDICVPTFLVELVKKRVISSKHSTIITQLKSLLDLLLEKIFKDTVGYRDYTLYSTPSRGKLRNIIIYGLCYNIQKYICSESRGIHI